MAFLKYKLNSGEEKRKEISWKSERGIIQFTIGSDKDNVLQLSTIPDVLPLHAIITRARAPVSYVLLDRSKGNTKVNDLPVWKLKAIRHLDRIHISDLECTFHEIHSKILGPDDTDYIGKRSILYGTRSDIINEKDEIVICRCGAVARRAHWFQLPRCSIDGCWYPGKRITMRTLQKHIYFELLRPDSELIGKRCPGQQPRDKAGFKEYDMIIRCPDCATPYHMECWLFQEICPTCKSYNIRTAVDKYLFGKDTGE